MTMLDVPKRHGVPQYTLEHFEQAFAERHGVRFGGQREGDFVVHQFDVVTQKSPVARWQNRRAAKRNSEGLFQMPT